MSVAFAAAGWLYEQLPPGFFDELDKVDFVKRKYGIPGPEIRPLLEQFSLIDSDRLRQAAEYGWGTGGASAGIPGQLDDELTPEIQRLIGAVAERWHGEAFDRFQSTARTFAEVLPQLTGPCQEIGQQLVAIADAFEMTWIEIIGWVATAVAVAVVVLSIIDIVPGDEAVVAGPVAVIAAVLGAISTAVSVWVTFVGSRSRFGKLEDLVALANETVRDKLPHTDDAPVATPTAGGWVRDSTDPTS